MACFNVWDIGGCGCSTGINCVTCPSGHPAIPTTLYVSDVNGGPYAATYPQTVNGATSWRTSNITVGSVTYFYYIYCYSTNKLAVARESTTAPLFWYWTQPTITCGSIHWTGTLSTRISGTDPFGGTVTVTQ